MININILIQDSKWKNYLKPEIYFKKKQKKINKLGFFKRRNLEITINLSSTKEVRKLNNKFRGKNKSTDVLAFPFLNNNSNLIKNKKKKYLGDIIINLSKIKFKDNKLSFLNELDKLWIHGLLHLCGYKHKKQVDYEKMLRKELIYLNALQ